MDGIIINKMLRVRGSKKEGVDKEEIINYEYRMIELSLPLVEPVICNPTKYLPWELQGKIEATVGHCAHSTAYLETYAYIMLMGSGPREEEVMEFKDTVYRVGRKCLGLAEQKLLVQFLCLIEYSRDKYSFLNKYPQIEAIFVRILQYLEEEHTNSDDSSPEPPRKARVRRRLKAQSGEGSPRSQSLSQDLQYQRQLQQIYRSFGDCFRFITLVTSNEFSCTFRLFGDRLIHLLIEKDCYFVLELADPPAGPPQYSIGVRPALSKRESQQASQSSSGQFDKNAFLDILNYKSEVQESKVISVERGSQIRKSPDSLPINTPKFQSAAQAFQCPQEFEIQQNQERQENDRTFIDELLNNVVMPEEPPITSEGIIKEPKMDKMKAILAIKEELRRVQLRIQGKIKLIDEAKTYQRPPHLTITPPNPTSQKLESSKAKAEEKEFRSNIVKESVVHKHQTSIFIKKERKTSYNSVKLVPYARHFLRTDDNPDIDVPSSPNNRGSAKPLQRVQRMLSEKAISRPQSNLKGIGEGKYRSRSPEGGGRKEYKVRSVSPKNVNVNVNVNINENLLPPSFPMPYKQLYHRPPPFPHEYKQALSHYYPPARPKPPPFLERVRSKLTNPQTSFPNGKMNLLVGK